MEFYKKLYTEKSVENVDLKYKLNKFDIPILSNETQSTLEGKIGYDELLSSLKNAKNNKSPGSDGFTAEFFKFFWIDIGIFLLRSINYGFSVNELSITQKEGIITCIPKQNKDRQYLKNWRPISLLNCTYKLASACLAGRLKKVLPELISSDQTGFMAGRYIGENIRIIYDLFYYTEKENIPGLLLLIDFEKAFDSVSWVFINTVLDFFNFGPIFKQWINVLYKNIKSCVHINGHLSEWFFLQRGCRQGDPISPYIFLLCAEILAILIRTNKHIKGIKVGDKEFVISQYADDTSFILDGTRQSLEQALIVLKFYANISGLGVNVEKTHVIWFGSMIDSDITLCNEYNLHWEKGYFSLLGITMSTNLRDIVDINYESKLSTIRSLFKSWSKRVLTPLGKLVVIKSLAIPKLNHLFLGLPNPTPDFIKKLQNMCYNFLWKNGPDKIKRSVIVQGYENGGLRMIDIYQFINALKISWIRRQIIGGKDCFEIHNLLYPFSKKFTIYGSDYIKNNLERIGNPFWHDTYEALHNFTLMYYPTSWNDFLCTPLWFNNNIKVGRK
ncbi:MAG: reverse transcriptase family protein, partial [gamma proteobacterium symbiont of Lucinoma myriamae]|nr:reverse transcriptase family protein [gamma proteobacterium symbiont of Lucinoma myriamae]